MGGRKYDDDDGHTIADMSDLGRNRILVPRLHMHHETDNASSSKQWPEYEQPFTRSEKRKYIFAALKAAFLIGGVYVIGLGLVILAIIFLWC